MHFSNYIFSFFIILSLLCRQTSCDRIFQQQIKHPTETEDMLLLNGFYDNNNNHKLPSSMANDCNLFKETIDS